MAHNQDVLRIDPNCKNTINTINRAELVGVQAWLKQVSQLESPPATAFNMLIDSQATLQSIHWQKAIEQPASFWLFTHEPLLMNIVANLKALTEAGQHVHLRKVKAHARLKGSIFANIDAAAMAKKIVTGKTIDAGGDLNDIPDEDLEAAGIHSTCNVSNLNSSSSVCILSPSMRVYTCGGHMVVYTCGVHLWTRGNS